MVKVAVAVVELSVIVSGPAPVPTVNVAVAAVFDVTVGIAWLDPTPPLTENRVLAVSDDQSVFTPVRAKLGVAPTFPEFGEIESVAVATVIVDEIESVTSLIVSVPVPEPVAMTSV